MDGIAYDASRASLTHPNWAPEEPGQPNPAHAGAGAIRDSDDIASVLRLRSLSEAKALRLWRLTYCIYANTTACPSGCRVPQAPNYQRTGSVQCVQLRGSRSSPSWCVRQAFPSTTIQSSGAPVYQIGSPRATNAARIWHVFVSPRRAWASVSRFGSLQAAVFKLAPPAGTPGHAGSTYIYHVCTAHGPVA